MSDKTVTIPLSGIGERLRNTPAIVYGDLPFVCPNCEETFFFDSESSPRASRWYVERLHESNSARKCPKCVEAEEVRAARRYNSYQKELMAEREKKEKKKQEHRAARIKRIRVTFTCDLCEVENTRTFVNLRECKMPKGWKQLRAYPAVLACPDCVENKRGERMEAQNEIHKPVHEVFRKISGLRRTLHEKEKQ